ncbi:hypothetical protein PMAYCL1PPCAC_20130 [Pristionchus mayeri]|uniref:Uncharacterized protein n=1 Tax=Pristionchus mayeri TaxID=1317129 RepID=A0AAN5I3B6_9BILA|nr:hypothetical protein PMAYCL1PPCAC_20130 [Pristionchus mayeri]
MAERENGVDWETLRLHSNSLTIPEMADGSLVDINLSVLHPDIIRMAIPIIEDLCESEIKLRTGRTFDQPGTGENFRKPSTHTKD